MTLHITAELGTAWSGNLETLNELAMKCKVNGIDSVKLQAFKREHLGSRYYRLASSVNPWNVEVINDIMEDNKMNWHCTVIYPDAVDFLKKYIKTWKVRYKDQHNLEIQNRIMETNPDRVFISCDEPMILNEDSKFKKLYCIPKYPHMIHEINWNEMAKMGGWSCHCPSIHALESAVKLGVKYLEIHITPTKWDDKLADNPVSFLADDLQLLVRRLREIKKDE